MAGRVGDRRHAGVVVYRSRVSVGLGVVVTNKRVDPKVHVPLPYAANRPLPNRWSSALASQRPGDRIATHDAGHGFSDIAFQNGAPRHERELTAFLDHRKPSARKIDMAAIDALDPCPGSRFGIGKPQLSRKLTGDARELAVP